MYRLWFLLSLPLFTLGCSSIGSTLGLSPDRHPLLEEAAQQRQYRVTELPHELQKALLEPYVLEPGDGLLLLPADLDSSVRLPSDQTILQDGTIDLGRYGVLVVAGKTVTEVEKMVRDAVTKITPDTGFIDVRLVGRQSKVYYVLGEVQTPGRFTISGSETVLDGLMQAGGLTDTATRKNIILVRPTGQGCATILAVDYSRVVQLGDVSMNYQLHPGDRIYVPTQKFKEQFDGHFQR